MKIVVKVQKPRAKQLNAILLSKRCERHADPKHLTRTQQEKQFRDLIKNSFD